MARVSKKQEPADRKPSLPATTDIGRENQLISLAFNLAERRMLDGTASATEVVHFLKAGSSREKLEHERLKNENLLLSAKVDALASAKRVEELFEEAISAFRQYSGQETGFGEIETGYMDEDYDDY